MKANGKNQTTTPNLQLAFDVGHSSIGWAVLQTTGEKPSINVLGCGAVTFPNDDCLASKRRVFRSQRRHARATRQRITRLAKLLLRLLEKEEKNHAPELLARLRAYETSHFAERTRLQGSGSAAPWLLAAKVLSAKTDNEKERAQLNWLQLWDVLCWYAHNRGYDHETWERETENLQSEEEQKQKQKDTEKIKKADELMEKLGKNTMAETLFAFLFKNSGVENPLAVERLPFFQNYFKGEKCAFRRETVRAEVRRILEDQQQLLVSGGFDANAFMTALLDDWRAADKIKHGVVICGRLREKDKLWLPRRYGKRQNDDSLVNGGLLFGRLSARFLNRMISRCPITFAERFNAALKNELTDPEERRLFQQTCERMTREMNHELSNDEIWSAAAEFAEAVAKTPNKHCVEFLEFRWAEQIAKFQIEAPVPVGEGEQFPDYKSGSLRSLSATERQKLDGLARARGFLRHEAPKPDKRTGQLKGGFNDLEEILKLAVPNHSRNNLDNILLVPEIEEAFRVLPIKGTAEAKTAFQAAWACFDSPCHDQSGIYRDDPMRHRFTTQLLRGKKLSVSRIIQQLRQCQKEELAEKIYCAARAKAADKKGKVNEEKAKSLLEAEFECERLSGRAPFSRQKMKEAVQQVFHLRKPLHPMTKGGCLERTDDVKRAELERSLPELTNNHLVRHRLLILERLFNELVNKKEYADGKPERIARVTIEVARDLQTLSGLTSKEKARELGAKHGHFDKVSEKVADALENENELRMASGQKPLRISYNLIRKARIADDLGWNSSTKAWPCPYSKSFFTVADLAHGRYDKDHIIPRSQRLSDALEALVITSREINALKENRTPLRFIREMSRPENDAIRQRLGLRDEANFRAFVENLSPKSNPFTAARAGRKVSDDDKRRWRRKQFLLTETWEEDDFKPGDLTKTSHIMKLARQRISAQFKNLPEVERPPVLNIPGAVTAAFRDKSWKLMNELAAVHPEVKKVHSEAEKARENGRDFNFKKAVRSITRLHHALDAIAVGLICDLLVPSHVARAGLNDSLARFIIKGKLNAEERHAFESLRRQLGLPKFYRWSRGRCDAPNAKTSGAGEGGQLCIDELPPEIKSNIRARLGEKLVAQHVPSDASGLGRRLTQNTSGILRVRDENGNVLWARGKNSDEELLSLRKREDLRPDRLELELTAPVEVEEEYSESAESKPKKETKPVIKAATHVLGFAPPNGVGKLTPMKGVRIIRDNYGLAILDHAAPGEQKFVIIPQHKVWKFVWDEKSGLIARNKGNRPRIVRNGMLVRLKNTKEGKKDGIWMVRSVKATLKLDLTYVDAPDVKDSGYGTWREVSVGSLGAANIEILPKSLVGALHIPVPTS